jgi:small conductance mechanosensitive channel
MEFSPEQLMEIFQAWGIKVLMALVILIVGRIVARILRNTLRKALRRVNVDEMLVSFASNIVYVLLLVMVIIAAINQLGVQTTSFIAIIGAAGLAVGLALQGSLANFAAGVMIIIFRPFKVGDFIDAGGTMGSVEEIEIFTTKMKTPDNKQIIMPNSQITSGSITNFSAKDTRRIDMIIGVSYADDLNKVKSVLESILEADHRVLKEPEPTIGVLELADSSINFTVRPWVKSTDYWSSLFDLNKTIKERFDQEDISIPFPQQVVHLHQVKSTVAAA